jgi:hypothetical protein
MHVFHKGSESLIYDSLANTVSIEIQGQLEYECLARRCFLSALNILVLEMAMLIDAHVHIGTIVNFQEDS